MTPTTLKESAARVVKISELPYSPENLPRTLIDYLSFANCCVNPNCKGEKFFDFCFCCLQLIIIIMNQ